MFSENDDRFSNDNSLEPFSEERSERGKKPSNAEIEAHIHELLAANPPQLDEVEDYVEHYGDLYEKDLNEFAFREAIRCGAADYVRDHAEDFDLNDADGCSSYLYLTENKDIQEILMDHGAFKSWDDYDECRFACETVNWEILAFDGDFQKEVFEEYLRVTGLTREKIIRMLTDEDYDAEEDDELTEEQRDRWFEEDFEALGVCVEDGQLTFYDMVGDSGSGTQQLLEELGWSCDFEGDSWKLNTVGVYFID